MILNFLKSSYQNLKKALAKTRSFLGDKLRALFSGPIDEDTLEKLEKLFYEADLGVQTAHALTLKVKELHRQNPDLGAEGLLEGVRQELLKMIPPDPPKKAVTTPEVILIVGVNGNGKTTTTAKLAKKYQEGGRKVILAAADTFRAAATEQLETWANRLGIDIVKGNAKGDPGAVVFDAIQAGKARGADVVIIDTAGRLHTKTHLMQELEKLHRVCKKVHPDAPHEIYLILDATTGQNALDQAKIFHHHTPLTGLILTKLDGTAKGGIVISLQKQLQLPVKFVGVGEGIDDLEPFDPPNFVKALFD